MRRIVVVAAGPAGTACAIKTKRRLPEHEINLILPAGLTEAAKSNGPYGKRLARMLPQGDLRALREVGVVEVTDIQPDLARRELDVTSERGALNIRYTSLALEIPAQSLAPKALQKAGNVFSLPADGFFAQAPACDAALLRAAAGPDPVLVVGCGTNALDAVFAAREAGCRVLWVQPQHMGEPGLEPLLERHILKLLGDAVELHTLPDTQAQALDFLLQEDGVTFNGIILPEKGPKTAACCLWAGACRARHPILREDGFWLDADGRLAAEPGIEENIGLHIMGSGVAAKPLRLGNGATAPVYAGGAQAALSTANRVVEQLVGVETPFPGLAGVRQVHGFDFTVCRAGYTMAEAEAAGLTAEHATFALAPAGGGLLVLTLVCCAQSRTLLGVQVMGHNVCAEAAEGIFDTALSALAEGTPLDRLVLRDWGGTPGQMLARCASMVRYKLAGPIKGITPDELLASAAAGAKFFMLDLRSERAWLKERLADSHNIPLEQLNKRLQSEVPRMMALVLIAEDSGDAYAAAVRLAGLGATHLYVLDGGIRLWPYALAR